MTPSKGTYLYELGTALFPKLRRGKIGRRTPKFFGGIFWTKNSIFTVVQFFFVNSPALMYIMVRDGENKSDGEISPI